MLPPRSEPVLAMLEAQEASMEARTGVGVILLQWPPRLVGMVRMGA